MMLRKLCIMAALLLCSVVMPATALHAAVVDVWVLGDGEKVFRFDTDPEIGKERGAVTKKEMAQMVQEARKNHIVLTPVFECLGHQDRLLSLPENRKYAEVQDQNETPWSF